MHFHVEKTTTDKLQATLDDLCTAHNIDEADILSVKPVYLGGRDWVVIARHGEHPAQRSRRELRSARVQSGASDDDGTAKVLDNGDLCLAARPSDLTPVADDAAAAGYAVFREPDGSVKGYGETPPRLGDRLVITIRGELCGEDGTPDSKFYTVRTPVGDCVFDERAIASLEVTRRATKEGWGVTPSQ